jgi:hypothetical protein
MKITFYIKLFTHCILLFFLCGCIKQNTNALTSIKVQVNLTSPYSENISTIIDTKDCGNLHFTGDNFFYQRDECINNKKTTYFYTIPTGLNVLCRQNENNLMLAFGFLRVKPILNGKKDSSNCTEKINMIYSDTTSVVINTETTTEKNINVSDIYSLNIRVLNR